MNDSIHSFLCQFKCKRNFKLWKQRVVFAFFYFEIWISLPTKHSILYQDIVSRKKKYQQRASNAWERRRDNIHQRIKSIFFMRELYSGFWVYSVFTDNNWTIFQYQNDVKTQSHNSTEVKFISEFICKSLVSKRLQANISISVSFFRPLLWFSSAFIHKFTRHVSSHKKREIF